MVLAMAPEPAEKAQFNVYLPKLLIRRAKYASIDTGQSLSQLVEDALTAHLDQLEAKGAATP
jgi:predicted HicB family RNase H-like nuclease